jgi:hypothetical protein
MHFGLALRQVDRVPSIVHSVQATTRSRLVAMASYRANLQDD